MKKLQTASKMPLDSFGTTATSHRKSIRTAGIPISTPIPTATNPWHSYTIWKVKLNKKDKHKGEVDKCLNEKGKQNSSSGHDIRIK